MKTLDEYVKLSKKRQQGGMSTTVIKPRKKIVKLELLPSTYLETKQELIDKQEELLKKYTKIQELRKKARNIPESYLIDEYKDLLGPNFVPELESDPGDVVESYVISGRNSPTYHYYYRFKQDASVNAEQYLPVLKEVKCMENRSGDMFTFRFNVFQQKDGVLKVQGLEAYSYEQVMTAFANVMGKTVNPKTTKKSNIVISQTDYNVIASLGMLTDKGEFYPMFVDGYTASGVNTQLKTSRITRIKLADRGGGIKPFSFTVGKASAVAIPVEPASAPAVDAVPVVAPVPEPVVEVPEVSAPEPVVEVPAVSVQPMTNSSVKIQRAMGDVDGLPPLPNTVKQAMVKLDSNSNEFNTTLQKNLKRLVKLRTKVLDNVSAPSDKNTTTHENLIINMESGLVKLQNKGGSQEQPIVEKSPEITKDYANSLLWMKPRRKKLIKIL